MKIFDFTMQNGKSYSIDKKNGAFLYDPSYVEFDHYYIRSYFYDENGIKRYSKGFKEFLLPSVKMVDKAKEKIMEIRYEYTYEKLEEKFKSYSQNDGLLAILWISNNLEKKMYENTKKYVIEQINNKEYLFFNKSMLQKINIYERNKVIDLKVPSKLYKKILGRENLNLEYLNKVFKVKLNVIEVE